MDNSGGWVGGFVIGALCVGFVFNPFNSALLKEAKNAEQDGRTISNDFMQRYYPRSFRTGSPAYLERDFEAGADFICDEIMHNYGADICAEKEIGWR
ncbi:MAG: hypothetical protein ACK4Y9_01390 [Hyphomonas sp.]